MMNWAEVNLNKVNDFEKNGFVVLENVLAKEEIQSLLKAGDQLVESKSLVKKQLSACDEATISYRNCIQFGDAFIKLLCNQSVFPFLLYFFGPDIKLLTSHLIYRYQDKKRCLTNYNPFWHRDFYRAQKSLGYESITRLDIKAAFCLTDTKVNGGGTLMIKGSHLLKAPMDFTTDEAKKSMVELDLKAGDCVLFENRTLHAGGVNHLDDVRKVVMMGYTYGWIESSDGLHQPDFVIEQVKKMYGDIGLQLIGCLPEPEIFDYTYAFAPIKKLFDEMELSREVVG